MNKLTVITSTANQPILKKAKNLRQIGKINHVYSSTALWGILFNQTSRIQIITDGQYLWDKIDVIDIAKWGITHDMKVTVTFTTSDKSEVTLSPICNRVYGKDTTTIETSSGTFRSCRTQTVLTTQIWDLVEEELRPLKQILKTEYLYNRAIDDVLDIAHAQQLPHPKHFTSKRVSYMQNFVSFWAPAYGLDVPQPPRNNTITPVHHRRIDPLIQPLINQHTEEKLAVKQQLNNLNIEYLTNLYSTYRQTRYYIAESLPMNEEYVICPVCQHPLNTKTRQHLSIDPNTGAKRINSDTDAYCNCCGESFTPEQIHTLLDDKYEEQDHLDFTIAEYTQTAVVGI